jgi:VanZ family protein
VTLRPVGLVAFAACLLLSLVVLFSPASEVPTNVPVSDKLVHFLLFVALGVTGRLAGLAPVPLLAGLVAYAGVSEVLQAVLPINRDGDVLDALADALGVVIGLAVGLGVRNVSGRANRRVGT